MDKYNYGMKPILFNTDMVLAILDGRKTQTRRVVKPRHGGHLELHDDVGGVTRLCERDGPLCRGLKPPYEPGDILWVRETWCANNNPHSDNFGGFEYRADYEGALCQDLISWHPSIHMPRKAARIWLRVTDVRVERLNVIMDAPPGPDNPIVKEGCKYGCDFIAVWENTIKPSDRNRYGWDANPWVWVICFERCSKPEEAPNE